MAQTLKRRNERLVTKEDDRKEEQKHIRKSLKRCGYPNWALKKEPKERKERKEDTNNLYVAIPYVRHLSEKLARTYRRFGISTTHKPSRTIKSELCNVKEKVHDLDKVNAIYEFKCKKHNATYVGETERPMKMRGYEHRVVTHKDSIRSHTCTSEPDKEQEDSTQEDSTQVRRSSRLTQKKAKRL